MIGLLAPWIGIFTGTIFGWIFFLLAPIALVYIVKTNKNEKSSFWLGWLGGAIILLVMTAIASANAF